MSIFHLISDTQKFHSFTQLKLFALHFKFNIFNLKKIAWSFSVIRNYCILHADEPQQTKKNIKIDFLSLFSTHIKKKFDDRLFYTFFFYKFTAKSLVKSQMMMLILNKCFIYKT